MVTRSRAIKCLRITRAGHTSAPLAQDSVKNVVIDQVELVYFAYDFSHGGGFDVNTSPMRYVQPVWRFSGKLDDGRLVQVLVQAVTDDYLSEP